MNFSEKETKVTKSLISKGIIPHEGLFEITDTLIESYVQEYSITYGAGKIGKNNNINYAKKLAYLTLVKMIKCRSSKSKVSRLNIRTDVSSGFIYLMANESFPDSIKIGSTRNLQARMSSYLTGDPYKSCKYIFTTFSENVEIQEKKILKYFEKDIINGEWIRITRPIKKIIDDIKLVLNQ